MTQKQLRVLIIGRGAREHALAIKIAQSNLVRSIVVIPGNGGTEKYVPKTRNIDGIDENNYSKLLQVAKDLKIDLVVPGPDAPIVDGIEDFFRGFIKAAQIEGSKAFSKNFMARHKIPTAAYANFTDILKAKKYIEDRLEEDSSYRMVIKASGLAAGKGVIIPETIDEAFQALEDMMLDGDEGPNTNGMGCYAPVKVATSSIMEEIERLVIKPTIYGLWKESKHFHFTLPHFVGLPAYERSDTPFVGMLFTGIMVTKSGPKCLEYNARFGDPEAQTLLPLLESDLVDIMCACIDGNLQHLDLIMSKKFCATVILASGGYPGPYKKGRSINFKHPCYYNSVCSSTGEFLEEYLVKAHVAFMHAGTKLDHKGVLLTRGGRVMAVTATMDTLEAAVKTAYIGVKTVSFEGMHFRKDIAHRSLPASKCPDEE
ncbi:hypothetical protein IFR05_000982 [Cadophora sp. M221]|nr:hypothetical protein IFR05_000982 [Cadophora sp. M221]